MAKATVKTAEVEVRQYAGPGTFTIMNDLKGELHAQKGDWLIGSEAGKIDVLSPTEFSAQYDLQGDLTEEDKVLVPLKQTPLVSPVAGAQPAAGIIAPTGSATRDSQPAPGIIDASQVPLTSGDTESLTVKSDSDLLLDTGGTVRADEAFPGTKLAGQWSILHASAGDPGEIILTLKKQ